MKAYIVGDKWNEDAGNIIVFAENIKDAKKQGWESEMDFERYIDMTVRRCKDFDGMENADEEELLIARWRHGWWFDTYSSPPTPEESTDQDFWDWHEKEYGF